jgi:hypothetical protein
MPVPYCSDPLKTHWRAALIREPTHRGNIAPCNARHFRHANKCSRQFRAGCATLPARRTPRFGGLSDLHTFECRSCEISHTEEGGPARRRDTDLFGLFRKQARECRRLATLAQDSEDRSFWLRLSEHWLKLAQGAGQRTS